MGFYSDGSHFIKVFLIWTIFKVFICYNIASLLWFFGQEACGILALQPGIEPVPPELKGKVHHWTARDVPVMVHIKHLTQNPAFSKH